ncbi:FTR1 family protein [Streptomyces sp. NPDC047108]|uniref:FTR1 family iron permease n=1 Tax=Streptomyces sp. NPDC047108 TaxID=3155025 RepID=UPI0033D1F7DA
MFATYLIGLREGLEAGLVVCALAAYLRATGNRGLMGHVWLGVGTAVVVGGAAGIAVELAPAPPSRATGETVGGSVALLAVALVTWLVFRMRPVIRTSPAEPHGDRDRALVIGVAGMALTAFLAVGREGWETVVVVWTAVRWADGEAGTLTGLVLGTITAVAVSWLLHRCAVRRDFTACLTWAAVLLIVVAAGALAEGVHDLQEAGVLPGRDYHLPAVGTTHEPDSWNATLFRGVFGFDANPTELQAACWIFYCASALFLFLRPARSKAEPAEAQQSS